MHTSPPTLPALLAGLRTAMAADARDVSTPHPGVMEALFLALIAQLFSRLESLALAWHQGALAHPAPGPTARLPFHLRARDARRARILSRASRGRLRIATWRNRNRGATAIPSRTIAATRQTARAPPHPSSPENGARQATQPHA